MKQNPDRIPRHDPDLCFELCFIGSMSIDMDAAFPDGCR